MPVSAGSPAGGAASPGRRRANISRSFTATGPETGSPPMEAASCGTVLA